MPYGLKPHIIEILKSVFSTYPKIEQVILYGSRAKGNFKKGSDIDITILGTDISTDELNDLENKIDDLMLPYTLDISIYKHLDSDNLIEHINRVGVEFYKKSEY